MDVKPLAQALGSEERGAELTMNKHSLGPPPLGL